MKFEGSPNGLSVEATTSPRGIHVRKSLKGNASANGTLLLIRNAFDIESRARIGIEISTRASDLGDGLHSAGQKGCDER